MRKINLHLGDFTEKSNVKVVPRYYGEALCRLAERNENIVALCADLAPPTETDFFRDRYPDRFFMMGIAEANMVGVASGMARMGDVPFVHSFCVFLTRRAYDQVAMQVAYPKSNVKLIGFLPGLTTLLGVSHQAIDDIALMRALPNMCVIEPCGPEQIDSAVNAAMDYDGPVYLRLNRAETELSSDTKIKKLDIGKVEITRKGDDLVIFACGIMLRKAESAAQILSENDIETTVVNVHTIKPIDDQKICELVSHCGATITAENHSIIGGLGDAVSKALNEKNISIAVNRVGIKDSFAEGGSTPYLLNKYGLETQDIVNKALKVLKQNIKVSYTSIKNDIP